MTLLQISQQRSASISTIIAASKKLTEKEKESEKSPQVPYPSEGTYQPADDPDNDKQKEAENAPIMPQPPTPP